MSGGFVTRCVTAMDSSATSGAGTRAARSCICRPHPVIYGCPGNTRRPFSRRQRFMSRLPGVLRFAVSATGAYMRYKRGNGHVFQLRKPDCIVSKFCGKTVSGYIQTLFLSAIILFKYVAYLIVQQSENLYILYAAWIAGCRHMSYAVCTGRATAQA